MDSMTNWATEEFQYRGHRTPPESLKDLIGRTRSSLREIVGLAAGIPQENVVVREFLPSDLRAEQGKVRLLVQWPSACYVIGFRSKGATTKFTSHATAVHVYSWKVPEGVPIGAWVYLKDPPVFQSYRTPPTDNYLILSRAGNCQSPQMSVEDFKGFMAYPE